MCPSYRGFSGSWSQLTAEYRVSADNWRPTTTATATKTSLKSEVALLQTWSRLFYISFNSSTLGNFFWSWILKLSDRSRKRRKKSLPCVHVLHKREIRTFHFVVMQWRQRNVQKRGRVVVGFANLKPFAFLPFSLTSPSSLLKLGERKQKRILENTVYRHESS